MMNSMKNINLRLSLFSALLLLISTSLRSNDISESLHPFFENVEEKRLKSLVEVLEELKQQYHVFFSYEESIVKDKKVEFEIKKSEAFEVAISRLMKVANLGYEIMSSKYCVIYSRDRAGLRKKKKLERKLRQIEKLESSGTLSLETSVDQSISRLETIASDLENGETKSPFGTKKRLFTGEIRGTITDATSGEPLQAATVLVKGTSLGDATTLEGEYKILGVPAGTHTLLFSYIGYSPDSAVVEVADNEVLVVDKAMDLVAIQGVTITVSAQRQGQNAAINQQVKSNSIINVVSSERIQELPDENAAESVGRLPGVSVSRSGGEGQRVNIRGLSPKFSSVTVDGVKIPATGQGRRVFAIAQGGGQPDYVPSLDDRSVDLSMISSEALAGIEVYKSLTPDQDGDAIGGKVNFITKKAPRSPTSRINAQLGHNHYHGTTENVKVNGVFSNRIFKDKLGIIGTAGYSTVDRSSDADQVDYEFRGATTLNAFSTNDNITTRERYNASAIFDYDLGEQHAFTLSSMYARTNVDDQWHSNRVGLLSNSASWSAGESRSNISLLNLSLGTVHTLPGLDIDWKVNFIRTEDNNPYSYSFGFGEPNPLTNVQLPQEDPYQTMELTVFDAQTAAGGIPGGGASNRRTDKNWIAQVNVKKPFSISSKFSGFFKVGGKLQSKDRARSRTNGTRMQSGRFFNNYLADHPEAIVNRNALAAANFLDPDLKIEPFFDGRYQFPLVLDAGAPKRLFDEYSHLRVAEKVSGGGDYTAIENIYAGYVMADLSLGSRLSIVGGVRYEHSDNTYAAYQNLNYNESLSSDGQSILTTGSIDWKTSTQNYGELLPMVNLKYQILKSEDNSNGLDIRLAATRTLTRPDYYNLTPFIRVNSASSVITRSESTLLPTVGWNYDAFATIFNNKFGLLTVGYFYKELQNIDFLFNRTLEPQRIEERFQDLGLTGSFSVIEPINATGLTTVNGVEVELQANLSFLPKPFDGIVLYGNVSKISSEAVYPFRISKFNFQTLMNEFTDTSRTLSMPGQSDDIANVSIGYDKGRFSGRISWNLQGPSLAVLSSNHELDVWTDEFTRIDLSLNFKVTDQFTIIGSVTNLQNTHDQSYTGVRRLPGRENIFGTTSWLGIRYTGGKK